MLDAAALAEILDPERKVSISVFEHIEAYQVVIDNRRKKQVKDDPNHTAALVARLEEEP